MLIVLISLAMTAVFSLLYVISTRRFRGEFSPDVSVAKTIWRLDREGRPGAKKMKVLFLCSYFWFVIFALSAFIRR